MRDVGDIVAVRNLKEPGAETTSTVGSAVDLGIVAPGGAESLAVLNVYAVSGTSPTLDLVVQGSNDGTTWVTAGTFAQKTGTAKDAVKVDSYRRYRYSSTIGGTTPSFSYYLDLVVRVPQAPAGTVYS